MSKVSRRPACIILTTTVNLLWDFTKKGMEGVWRHAKDKAAVKPCIFWGL